MHLESDLKIAACDEKIKENNRKIAACDEQLEAASDRLGKMKDATANSESESEESEESEKSESDESDAFFSHSHRPALYR